jgi:hypothetical protein
MFIVTVAIVIIPAFVLLLYATLYCPFQMELDKRELFFDNLPDELDGKTIFFCGDLHLRQWDYRIIWVQHQMKKAAADLILFSGDIVEESGVPFLEEFLSPLSMGEVAVEDSVAGDSTVAATVADDSTVPRTFAPLGMCFVPGNNENHLKDKEAVFSVFEKIGFKVLLNSSFRAGPRLVIAGTDDPSRNHDDLELTMTRSLTNAGGMTEHRFSEIKEYGEIEISDRDFIIALTHSPELFPLCVDKKIPLTLAGHTHGGQVRAPWIGALWVDTPRTGGKYDAGIFEEKGCQLLVTRGVGMSKLPLRCLCNPEVHLLTLRKGCSSSLQ